MMPNIVDGGDMGGLIRYLVGPGRANEHVEPHLVAGSRTIMNRWGDWDELSIAQASEIANYLDSFMQETDVRPTGPIRKYNPDTGKNEAIDYGPNHVWHCSLSLSPDEGPLSEEKWAAIAQDFMDEMEFTSASGKSECRWVAVHHGTSKNGGDHIHIAANTVREDGTKWWNWQDQRRSQRACNTLEHKYGLRIVESRQHNRGSRCDSAQALNAAKREGRRNTDRAELELRLRAASKAAAHEADFIGRARSLGVRLRPRFAKGRTDVVVGYSAALHTRRGQKTQWYGGGSISRDLTLSALRERWPNTIESVDDAVEAWRDAWKGKPFDPQRKSYTAEEWQGHKQALELYRGELRTVDPTDPLALANASNDVAGLLAAAAQQPDLSEGTRNALDYSARQVGRNAQLKSRPAASSRTNAWVVLGAQLLSTAVTPKHSQMNYALMIVATLELVQVLADLYRQAQQVNTANMILRDTRAVYDRLRDETPSVATSSFAQLEARHTPLQQDTLPEPDQADQPVTTEQVTVEPVLVGAGIEPQREETYEQQLRKRHKFLNTSAHPLFDSPEARQRRKQEKESRQGKPPLPGLGVPPVLRKAKNPTTPNHVPKQDRSRGHGRSL